MKDHRTNELLAYLARRGDTAAREALFVRLRPWVHALAKRYANTMLPVEDLVQEGLLGLLDALEKFQLSRGQRFQTYAAWRIRGAMLDACRDKSEVIYTPRKNKNAVRTKQPDYVVTESGDREEIDVAGPDAQPSQLLALAPWLKGLSKAERLLLIGYYVEDQTMKQIGQQLGLAESRVSQMHAALIARFRKEAHVRAESEDSLGALPYQRLQGPPRSIACDVPGPLVPGQQDAA